MGCTRSSLAFNYYTRITSLMILLPSSPTVRGFTANNLRGLVRYLQRRLECRIVRGSAATACLMDRSVDGAVCTAARAVVHASRRACRPARRLTRISLRLMVRGGPGILPDSSLAALRRRIPFEKGPVSCPTAGSRRFGRWFSQDGPSILPGGSLALVRFGGSFNAFGACQTARATTASRVR